MLDREDFKIILSEIFKKIDDNIDVRNVNLMELVDLITSKFKESMLDIDEREYIQNCHDFLRSWRAANFSLDGLLDIAIDS